MPKRKRSKLIDLFSALQRQTPVTDTHAKPTPLPAELIVERSPAGSPSAAMTPANAPNQPMDLLRLAIEKGLDVSAIERLQAMCERAADRAAAMEFNAALAAFQDECPEIPKTRSSNFTTKGGSAVGYKYASLDDILRVAGPFLHRHGLSHSFDSVKGDHGLIEVCTLRHVGGHFVSASSPVVPMETRAGMSAQQAVGSAQTYARRYAFTGVTGTTTGDEDNDAKVAPASARYAPATEESRHGDGTSSEYDGHGEFNAPGDEPLTPAQILELAGEIVSRDVDQDKFETFMGVTDFKMIRQSDFQRALHAIRRKRVRKDGAP